MSLPALIYLERNCKTPFHALYSRTTQSSILIIIKVSCPKSMGALLLNLISESNLIEYADDRSLGWHQRLHFPRYYPPNWTFISYLIGLKQRQFSFHFEFRTLKLQKGKIWIKEFCEKKIYRFIVGSGAFFLQNMKHNFQRQIFPETIQMI